MTKVFVVSADDSISVLQREPEAPQRESRLPEILKQLEDPNFSAVKVSDLINEEIALVNMEIRECGHRPIQKSERDNFQATIEALLLLRKTMVKAEKIPDQLNFDGPKFQHFLYLANILFEKAVRDALGKGGKNNVDKIMKNLEDEMAAQMPKIRREVEEIGSSPGGDLSQSGDAKNGSAQSE